MKLPERIYVITNIHLDDILSVFYNLDDAIKVRNSIDKTGQLIIREYVANGEPNP